jgi:geranylgeranyl diphosphate synthase, type I
MPSTPPAGLVQVAERVQRRLTDLLDGEMARWALLAPDLVEPLQSLTSLVLAGGKRLRPAFCHWGYVGAGGTDEQLPLEVGAAFEMLQAFALLHDDVMDDSDSRRGMRTTHSDFADRHAKACWRGESRRFGEAVAVLTGDLAHVYADMLMASAPADALVVWNELRIELNMGQYLDVLGTARGETDYEATRTIARYKSGKYTIERPLHVGAALAGRLDELREPLTAYGDPLGEAFQLRDDVLGAFGESGVTGKPVGDDLRDGKPTPLLSVAVSAAGPAQARLLDRIGAPDLSDGEVSDLQAVLVDTGAAAEIEATIDRLTTVAMTAICRAPITDSARTALVELAAYVARRAV